MPKKPTLPLELRITSLEPGNLGVGVHAGKKTVVRGVPPGALVKVWPIRKKRGVLHARRDCILEPAPGAAVPRCGAFSICGGCSLQEIGIEAQRQAKQDMVLRSVGEVPRVHPVRSGGEPWGYRNKIELAYGNRRFLVPDEHRAGLPNEGSFLGFHTADRFDRIVEFDRCEISGPALNACLGPARAQLRSSSLACWDVRACTGFWRHLILRENLDGDCIAAVFTAVPADWEIARQEVKALAEALHAARSLVWFVNERTCDAAVGEVREVFGADPWLEETLSLGEAPFPSLRFKLSPRSFFQANTRAAEVLYRVVAEAAGRGRALLDLYCGTGTIGLALAPAFESVLGIDENPDCIEDAQRNSQTNNIFNTRHLCGRAESLIRDLGIEVDSESTAIVDPPRAGLHPDVCRWLAALPATRLVYVACHAPSLGRDRVILEQGGWRLAELWTVDLFPQTGHIETVGLFLRSP